MQHGDRKRLEQAQRVAPRAKKQNASGQTAAARPQAAPRAAPNVEIPDAIEFISGRGKGTFDPATVGAGAPISNIESWKPLLQALVRDPNTSGPLATTLIDRLKSISEIGSTVGVDVLDMNAVTDAVEQGLS